MAERRSAEQGRRIRAAGGSEERRAAAPEAEATQQERKKRVLTQGAPAVTRSIADAVVVKDKNLFMLTERDGRIPMGTGHGFGLYYHDCRYLNGYTLDLAGTEPNALVANAVRGHAARLELTNVDLHTGQGDLIPKDQITIRWGRVLIGDRPALHDRITIRNLGMGPAEFPLTFAFRAEFEDIFAVRELLPRAAGELREPEWRDGALGFLYTGRDDIHRSVAVRFSRDPTAVRGGEVRFDLALAPRERTDLILSIRLAEARDRSQVRPGRRRPPDGARFRRTLERPSEEGTARHTSVRGDSLFFNRLIDRSLRDLGMLRSHIGGESFFAAGVPWFGALFGRDSLITALQTLAFDPDIAVQTLRVLARHQGRRVDAWREEAPGKILHELRRGERARSGEIPYRPYFGTVDATPLFLILVARHAAWTGDLSLFRELRRHIERALRWMDRYGDFDGDGYLEYESTSDAGLINQGWKDSGDAIVDASGELADPPIKLVEVQAYAYFARVLMADLFGRVGEDGRAASLRRRAEQLRARFNRDFWVDDRKFYALALQAGGRPAAAIASNPGHALWAGIADAGRARLTRRRLMADDMFSGWGVRTLSEGERRYSPIGYHLGTVWPHDNSIIAAGFRRYGFDAAARRIIDGIIDAAMYFDLHRLPELFAGYRREEYGRPVRYPVANHPQAWGAGSVPFLVETMLGLEPKGFERRLYVRRPMLPGILSRVDVRGLRVGAAEVDLTFEREGDGVVVHVDRTEGPVDVIVES